MELEIDSTVDQEVSKPTHDSQALSEKANVITTPGFSMVKGQSATAEKERSVHTYSKKSKKQTRSVTSQSVCAA